MVFFILFQIFIEHFKQALENLIKGIMGSMFCCSLLYVHSSFAIILMAKRELVALLSLSSWCLVIVVWLFLAVPWVCLQFVSVVFPDHTHFFRSANVPQKGRYAYMG